MSTARTFADLVKHLAARSGQVRPDEPFPELLERLSHLDDPQGRLEIARVLESYASTTKRNAGRAPMEAVRSYIALSLLGAALRRYGDAAPLIHHWVPLCYLKGFVRDEPQETLRTRRVPGTRFDGEHPRLVVSEDRQFAHGVRRNGDGHYELPLEKFFSIIEGSFSAALGAESAGKPRETNRVYIVALAVIQALRLGSDVTTLAGAARALVPLLDSFGEAHITLEQSLLEPLGFLTSTPLRRRTLDGEHWATFFPISSDCALLIASRELGSDERQELIAASNRAAAAQSRRTGETLHGVLPSDLVP